MDFKQIAADVTVFLTPFLPYLILGGEETAKMVGKKFGEATWEKAKFLWSKIKDTTTDDSKLNKVASNLAEVPEDEDFQFILAKSLAKHLEEFPQLASQLVDVLKDDRAVQSILIEQGSKVKDIHQRLSKTGKQEATVRGSQTGNIIQEQ